MRKNENEVIVLGNSAGCWIGGALNSSDGGGHGRGAARPSRQQQRPVQLLTH